MSSKFYPNGAGGTLGDQLDTCRPLITSGNVWYVSSLIGTDAASPAGQNREKPLATIAQAVTNAADEDIIVFLQGHTESLTAAQNIAKRLQLVGEGTVSGKPGVTFNTNSAAGNLFTTSALSIEFRNIYFPEATQTNTAAKIAVGAAFCRFVGCYFELGAKDTGVGVSVAADGTRFDNCTFISTATLRTAQPLVAIKSVGVSIDNVEMNGVVVSAGTVGFSNYSAVDFTSASTLLRIKALGISLLLGADMDLPAAWKGNVNVQLATGGSRVNAP